MAHALRFGSDYAETISLPDGRKIRLRAIRSEDREKMREGLLELSPQSRYRRFFTDKQSLSDSELDYLTRPDGLMHFAIVAGEIDAEGREGRGAGVARFITRPSDPRVAEPAIVVVDAFQQQGLGRALMDRLIASASERGVQRFRSEVLALNTPMLTLLDDLAPNDRRPAELGVIVCEFPVGPPLEPALDPAPGLGSAPGQKSDDARPSLPERSAMLAPFDRILRAVAEGRAELSRRAGLTEQWFSSQIFGAMAALADDEREAPTPPPPAPTEPP